MILLITLRKPYLLSPLILQVGVGFQGVGSKFRVLGCSSCKVQGSGFRATVLQNHFECPRLEFEAMPVPGRPMASLTGKVDNNTLLASFAPSTCSGPLRLACPCFAAQALFTGLQNAGETTRQVKLLICREEQ